ncbi:MAG: histidinol-phosphate transaminase [Bacteroidales bacterium]|nr:histidinol-phosphate transaminase [Bacteroidales bacterium]
MKELIRPNILALEPYSTARDEYKGELGIMLDANENPYENGINRYPQTSLRRSVISKLAASKGVAVEKLFLGNGSDEAIDLCYRVFCRPGVDNAVMIAPSYGMYSVCASVNDVECRKVQLNEDFSLPVDALLAASDANSKLLFICSPNNPTGNAYPVEEIEGLIQKFPGIVVVDEAYIDFSSRPSLVPLTEKYDRLIVLQTLSKAHGMAGLRMGLAIADAEIIRYFDMVRYPYNVGSDTLAVADGLLPDDVTAQIEELRSERAKLAEDLNGLKCVRKVYPSDANFILAVFDNPREAYNVMIAEKIIVRDRSTVKGCEGSLRITVGTPDENVRLMEVLKRYDA